MKDQGNSTIQSRIVRLLAEANSLRVFTPNDLTARLEKSGVELHNAKRTQAIAQLLQESILTQVRRGVYLNRLAKPEPTRLEALPWIRQGAVLSLASVLSEAGVLTNPSSEITAVAPNTVVKRGFGERKGETGFKVYLMPKGYFPSHDNVDAWQPKFGGQVTRATPEKALLDWLYLAGENKLPPVPVSAMELDELDQGRLERLAKRMRLVQQLEAFQSGELTDKRGNALQPQGLGSRLNRPGR